MKRIVVPILVAVAAGGVCWFFGLGILPSVIVLLVVGAACVLLYRLTPAAANVEWPTAPPIASDGLRRETSNLSWALRTRNGIVDDAVIVRVRAIAVNRLARRQLSLDNPAHRPAIEALIGARVYSVLSPLGTRPRVRLAALAGTLEILERLDHIDTNPTH
jgi:hypothetical protein